MTDIKKVRIQDILDSQIPEYLREDSPLFKVFLSEYYNSLTHKSGAIDLANNLKQYKDIDVFNITNLIPYTALTQDVLVFDDVINVASTLGWPEKFGLLKIDDEIITYHQKTPTSFTGCVRGFSGIDQIKSTEKSQFLQFSTTKAAEHRASSTTLVYNLSNLFIQEFFEKYKSEFLPGFESRSFVEGISIQNILTRAKDFYTAKGTDTSYKILFKILYGKKIEIIKPQDYTIIPSSNSYFTTKNILVEKISGADPTQIRGNFLYQDLPNLGTASASIFNVEFRPLSVTGKSLYEISLDSTSFDGTFSVTGKTKILETVPTASNTILVDSTVGFSKSGTILVKPENSNFIEITYTDTTSNQFLGVSGVTQQLDYGLDVVEEKFAYSYIGVGNTSRVEFRIVNVIDNVDFSKTSNLRVGDKVKLSGFGRDLTSRFEFNNWIYNLPTNHKIKSISQQDSDKFRIFLYDSVSFYKNEIIHIEDNLGELTKAKIIAIEYSVGDIVRKYSNRILVQTLEINSNILSSVLIKKIIYKSNHYSNYFPNISSIPTGVQNTYISSDEENFYVTSTGLPNYPIFVTDTKKSASTSIGSSTTDIVYAPNHNFTTGESIYYQVVSTNTNISSGSYFVTAIDQNNFNISYSKSDVYSKKYIQLNHNIFGDFVYKVGYQNKTLKNQKLLKKFNLSKNPYIFDDKNKRTTNNRELGLFVNGVEILSPTLFDENVYYGKLTSIEVTNPGKNYDVINVAPIEVKDDTGIGAKAHLNLIGEVKEIRVISPGIGYQSKPKITITGGNGSGCVLESNLVKSRISVGFKPELSVSIANNTITFLNNHHFNDAEEVIYSSNQNIDIAGLVDKSHYYVGIVSEKQIKLYNNVSDAFNKSNPIDITGISSGFHNLETLKSKNTITKVYVKDPGKGYSNRAITFPSALSVNNVVGVNTYDSYIFATNHRFNDGDLVDYSTTDTPITGLSTNLHYYVKVLDSNRFKLAAAGVGTNLTRDNFINKKFVQFKSLGIGTHRIAYPPITISVESLAAIASTSIVKPVLEPLVLGSVSDVYLEEGGIGYGCTNVINFHRRPNVGLSSITSECLLKPIIINGTINDVKIINKGRGYRIDSDIIISGEGNYAELKPIISDGRVIGVDIIKGGVGYASSNTVLTVLNRGIDAKFLANVFEWKINQVVKSKSFISDDDDGLTYPSKNPELELQFIHFYTPKKLRYQLDDNFTETNKEVLGSKTHSPILGFAYDGYPIYGPYGYDPLVGGSIRQVRTGYTLQLNTQPGIRPPSFEPGYFINDYIFTGTGDLDESNGRWCITPQYPNGTYAYFISINVDATGKSVPTYPYVLGEYFKGTPIEENFLPKFNQNLDLSTFSMSRNVGPYYLTYNNSYYDLIDKVSDNYKQEFRVSDINYSGITSTSIFASGTDYQVDDRLIINNINTSGSSSNIVISRVEGIEVESFSVVENKLDDVNFIIQGKKVICKTDYPHELKNNENVSISGISTISSSGLEGIKKVTVIQKEVELSESVPNLATTGVSTFITVKDVSGFSINDVIGIGTETLRITNVSPERSRFYVNRISNSGVHTAGLATVFLLPTTFEFGLKEPNPNSTRENYITFFDPKEAVGTGTAGVTRSLVGIGTSTIISRFIPTRSIYLPNHRFYTGQSLIYDCGVGGTSLSVNNVGSGVSFILARGSTVYAVNLGTDYIGLSTIGFTSTSGIGTTLNSLEFVNFDASFGAIGFAHSLLTTNPKITGTVERFTGIVTTSSAHNLTVNDEIDLSIENNQIKTIKLLYNPEIRKLTSDKVSFGTSEVSTSENTIDLTGQDLKTGDKIVYTSSNPIGGLENNGVYFVVKTDINKIRLCEYQSDIGKSEINFTSPGSSHNIALINPPLTFIKGDIAKFDLSDSSITDMYLEFYEDPSYQRKIELIGNDQDGFVIYRTGTVGTADAYVSLDTLNKYCPNLLFYNLVPKSPIDERKYQISSDLDVSGNNKVSIQSHLLNQKFKINISNETTFNFNINKKPTEIEKLSYNSSIISYTTNSKSAYGPISKLKINFPGRGYKKLPFVERIETERGKSAVIKLISPNVGKVESYERVKDGFDYPTDPTLTPTLSVPTVIGIKDIRTIDYVGIITAGKNYNNSPTLYVKEHPYIQLEAELIGGSVSKVNVISNVTDLKKPLEISSLNNSNGYDIDNIQVSGTDITLELLNSPTSYPFITTGYGKTEIVFPFEVGDEIFIEGCRLTPATASKANFNSISYGYRFFSVTGINTSNNTVTYSMAGISTGAFGTYNDDLTLGYVVNKKDMPVFEMILKDDVAYLSNERVTSNNFNAIVMEGGWDNELNQMRVNSSFGELRIGDKIIGESSKINGTVEYFDTFNLLSTLGVSRDKVGVIDNSVGILDDFQQRISDNFYYQKFSYSIKSEIPYDTWRESVRSIIHPSGFKEFSDLEIYTKPTVGTYKSTNLKPSVLDNTSNFLVNLDNHASVYKKDNFAIVYEEDFLENGSVERVFFSEGVPLRNYILNKTNKVIKIDDIGDQFTGTTVQTLDGRFADASDLLDNNRSFIQEEVVGFITATYPGITTNVGWSKTTFTESVGYVIDAISHDIKYKSNNKSIEEGLDYWNGIGTSYIAGIPTETIEGFRYITDLSKYIINNVGVKTSYQLGTSIGITTAVYNNVTGITTITTSSSHGLSTTTTNYVVLKNLVFSCNSGGGINTAIFPNLGNGPDGNGPLSPKGFVYEVEVIDGIRFRVNPGPSTITHNYVSGGTIQKAFISTSQYIDPRILLDIDCSNSYSENCCADVWTTIGNYVGIITTIIGIGTTAAPTNITYPSTTKGGQVVGLSTFKLKNKGTPLFKREFDSSSSTFVDLINNCFILPNHNFQTGQQLIYDHGSNSPIGIATTTQVYSGVIKDVVYLTTVYSGTAIYENGYGQPITTSITGTLSSISPGPPSILYSDVVGIATTAFGNGASFDVLVTYGTTTGNPLSYSVSLNSGGSGYFVGDKVSISGTYFGGTDPTNNLSFTVSDAAPTGIQTQANQTYSNVPSTSIIGVGTGAIFNVSRDNDGRVDSVTVINGGTGYSSTSRISIAGTYVGGASSDDDIIFSPDELATNKLPRSLYVYKLDDSKFRVSGLSSSLFFDLTSVGSGIHSISYAEPNSSTLITIDGVVQTAIRRKSLAVSLGSSVSTATTTIFSVSSGISSLNVYDIINIGSEYVTVKSIGIGSTNSVEVVRGTLGTIAGIHTVGASATVLNGDFNIVGDVIYFKTSPYGKIGPVGLQTGSIFAGRVFSRKFDSNVPQDKNILFDDISLSFTGIAATEFTLKVDGQTTTTVFNDVNSATSINNNPFILINNVPQTTKLDFDIDGSSENVIRFLSGTPSAGRITKVAITTGFGYQPLLPADGSAVVSVSGTISSVTLTGPGSGYRQPPVVSIASTVGSGASVIATVGVGGTITSFTVVSAGSGYTTSSPPTITVGFPTGYSYLGVAYTGGSSGVGSGAKVSVVVGQGSSIISFNIDNPGLGYKVGDILSVPGITTNPGLSTVFQSFTLTVKEVQTDTFSGFYPGQFIIFDDVSSSFNGFRKKFTLSITKNNIKEVLSLKVPPGTDLDITNNIAVYINDIIQSPGDSYTFSGSRISFKEAPKPNSKCTILYYRGSSVDVEEIEPPKTIKEGDTIFIKENKNDLLDVDQLDRVVKKIVSSDQLDTFTYSSVGILTDPTKIRPLTWIKQTKDRIISGSLYSKSRPSLASNVRPNAKVIKRIQPTDNVIYVDNAFPLFSKVNEIGEDLRDLIIIDNKQLTSAISTSIVSTSSSISSIIINSGGTGYASTQNPVVTISKSFLTRKDPIKDWQYTIGISTSYELNSVAKGNIFVSVGNSSVLAFSETGSEWNAGLVGFGGTIAFNSISCGGTNNFCAVGSYAVVSKSIGYANTISSWTTCSLIEEQIVPGLGVVAKVGTSYTGILKDVTYSPYLDSWTVVGSGGSIFGAAGIGSTVFTSRFSSTLQDVNSVVAGPTRIIAVGGGGAILSTVNNEVWEVLNSPTFENLTKVIYADNQFVSGGSNGTIIRSSGTGSVFNVITTNLTEDIVDLFYTDFYIVLTSTGKLYYSFNLSDWVYRDTNQANVLKQLIFAEEVGLEGRYVGVGFGGTAIYADPIYNRATAISSVTAGVVTSIEISNGGFGYDVNNPPPVLIEQEKSNIEKIRSFKVQGDFGTIIGINTFVPGTPGIGTTSPKVEFVLKSETYDNSTLGIGYSSLNTFGVTYSSLGKGDCFVITDSNVTVGHALTGITTSLGGMSNYPASKVGTAYTYLDGVYMVESVTSPSSGIVTVTCNFAPIEDVAGNYVLVYPRGSSNSGINTNNFYGRYSWSKIYDYQNRILDNPKTFEVYNDGGISGISTNPQVVRTRGV